MRTKRFRKHIISSEPQITSEASGVLETISHVSIGDVTFDVDSVNSDNGIVRIYNRDYKTDRFNLSIVIPADYACATFKTYSDYTYSLEGIDKKSGGSVDIPVNGFLLLIPISMVENVSFENGTTAVLTEYTSPEYENLAICSVIPSKRAHARRINMLYPESGEPLEGKIYFCSEESYTPLHIIRSTKKSVLQEVIISTQSPICRLLQSTEHFIRWSFHI